MKGLLTNLQLLGKWRCQPPFSQPESEEILDRGFARCRREHLERRQDRSLVFRRHPREDFGNRVSPPLCDLVDEGATGLGGANEHLAAAAGAGRAFDPSASDHPVDRPAKRRRVRAHPLGQAPHSKGSGAGQNHKHAKMWERNELECGRNGPSYDS